MNDAKPLVGGQINDPHKNTAKCGHVNDRLRRRAKRLERQAWMKEVITEETDEA